MSRKTIKVEEIKNRLNELLANYDSNICSSEYILGQRLLLEDILFQTGNYNGFQFLEEKEVPRGEKPGVIWIDRVSYTDNRTDGNRVRYL